MASAATRPDPVPEPAGPGASAWWSVALLGLFVWHGWLTLSLFGPDEPWRRLLDDAPVVSGRHALHLYHGQLGAQSLLRLGTFCCFDPAFQAGYPKTPVFDSDSRPAELFLLVGGAAYRPAAYKVGLALCCLLAPLLVAGAAQAAGLNRAGGFLAGVGCLLVWWGAPAQAALHAGDLDLLVASLAAVLQLGLLVRFDRAPGLGAWLGILISGNLAWFADPLLSAALLPLALAYYLTVGARHRLVWHLALLLGLAGAVALNAWWLVDWFSYWWIRVPLAAETPLLAHRTFHALWNAPIWGHPADRTLALSLLVLGTVGVWRWNQSQQRAAARLFGLGAVGLIALAVAGAIWSPLGAVGSTGLVVPGLLLAVVPAVHALAEGCRFAARRTGCPFRGTAVVAAVGVLVLAVGHRPAGTMAGRWTGAVPLTVGLNADRLAVVEALTEHTTADARILWEDLSGPEDRQRWTVLLPGLTGRAFVGGLDPDAGIEHAYAGLTDETLAGRPLGDWTDAELEDYCRRYNVGWVACWSQAAAQRFRAWPAAAEVARLHDGGPGVLFAVHRPLSFALKGQARWLGADRQRIVLGDVVPEDGEVVLSLHYQAGLQASPGRVVVERELDPHDPIPFVRLRLPGPVARVTLTWEGGK
jgi:hypothetical protein